MGSSRSVAASTVDAALQEWAKADRAAAASGAPAAPALQGSRAQLEAEVLRLRRELAAAVRGSHVSERVDTEMRRVKRLWQEAEHRLLLLQSELRTALVTQRTLGADLRHAEALAEAQGARIEELAAGSALDAALVRERGDGAVACAVRRRVARVVHHAAGGSPAEARSAQRRGRRACSRAVPPLRVESHAEPEGEAERAHASAIGG